MGRKEEKTRIKEMEKLVADFKATFAQLTQDDFRLPANLETDSKGYGEDKKKHGS